MQENTVEDREIGHTYKSLFLGACGLISLAFGWWFTGFISAFDALTAAPPTRSIHMRIDSALLNGSTPSTPSETGRNR